MIVLFIIVDLCFIFLLMIIKMLFLLIKKLFLLIKKGKSYVVVIVVGCILVGFILIGVGVYFIRRRYRRNVEVGYRKL